MQVPEDSYKNQDDFSSLLDETGSGVSKKDQTEILSKIENIFGSSYGQKTERELSYEPKRNGVLLPILICAAVLLLTLFGVWYIYFIHNRAEQSIITTGSASASTEGALLSEFRRESEQKITESEEEIRSIQEELNKLEQERNTLSLKNRQLLDERTEELERELEKRLQEERTRLDAEGLNQPEVDRRLEDFEQRISREFEQEIEEMRAEADAALQEKEEQIGRLTAEYRGRLDEYESDRQTALREMRALQRQREEAELYVQQVSSAYLAVLNALNENDFDAARRELEGIEELLLIDAAESLPSIGQRVAADHALVSALSRLISFAEASAQGEPEPTEGRNPEETKSLEVLNRTISQQTKEIGNLNGSISTQQEEIERQKRTIARQERELARLKDLESLLGKRTVRLSSIAESLNNLAGTKENEAQEQQIFAAIEDRLEIIEILNSDAVRRQNPEIEKTFEKYLSAMEQEYLRQGYQQALTDIRSLIESVIELQDGQQNGPYIRRRESGVLQNGAQLIKTILGLLNQ